ncbi:MAG: UDP-3-O-acyl-N-acetylglucosamine deacetylase [Planctomycetia bacterium]|nr:UDP-3-O-acyl-N-acetylglucosamine deacetylase [Planctomycetia bacterium]
MSFPRFQRTLAAPVKVEGFGYWSGKDVEVEFRPAEVDAGIVFVRKDLPARPRIAVSPENRLEIPRRTSLGTGNGRVEMVEHVLAALAGMWVDNCEIHVTAAEMPGLDGSAYPFVAAFDSVGYVTQEVPVHGLAVREGFRIEEHAKRWMEVTPLATPELSISFEIHYDRKSCIGDQFLHWTLHPETFRREIAPCRTFVTQQEAQQILDIGLAKRATYHDLLVFNENGPIDNTLRFPNECVRHKILDLLGDLTLGGVNFYGHIHGYCSGHDLNVRLVRQLLLQTEPHQNGETYPAWGVA